ncbi:hypothetical protein LWC34_07515 [Kibdelosporangium philippinense]|uniref:Uncharacterized protein n=1 Tax=Kibdelosporangium philippinense TaxID=211113 RepID=A0ABS8Z427_9PSEU|nr:hypothetical protein [Kibdelosporangium philippinense]MCE7002678.1 hypothetical protein [Kibdelosporangium philippinense]
MRSRVIRIYQPWPTPVRAACYTDPAVLPEIDAWVDRLRERGLVPPDVDFVIRDGEVGVLNDRDGEHELRPTGFLVFGRGRLQVLDESTFFGQYHDPAMGDI